MIKYVSLIALSLSAGVARAQWCELCYTNTHDKKDCPVRTLWFEGADDDGWNSDKEIEIIEKAKKVRKSRREAKIKTGQQKINSIKNQTDAYEILDDFKKKIGSLGFEIIKANNTYEVSRKSSKLDNLDLSAIVAEVKNKLNANHTCDLCSNEHKGVYCPLQTLGLLPLKNKEISEHDSDDEEEMIKKADNKREEHHKKSLQIVKDGIVKLGTLDECNTFLKSFLDQLSKKQIEIKIIEGGEDKEDAKVFDEKSDEIFSNKNLKPNENVRKSFIMHSSITSSKKEAHSVTDPDISLSQQVSSKNDSHDIEENSNHNS